MTSGEADALFPVQSVVAASAGVSRLRLRVGWALFVLSTAVYGAAVVLNVRAETVGRLLYPSISATFAVIGVVLTSRRPDHRISWLFAATGLWGAVGGLASAYAFQAIVVDPGSLPGGIAAAWLDNWWWLPELALPIGALLVLMPDGHLATRHWWPVPSAVVVGVVLASIGVSASPTFDLHTVAPVENPLAGAGGTPVAAAGILGVILIVAGLVGSLGAFVVRLRRSSDEERLQLRWVGLSLGFAVPLFVVGAVAWDSFPGAQLLPALAFLALPIGTAVAILKYRLYEIDLVINRSLVYGSMTVGVVAVYVAVVALVGATLSSRANFLVSLVVTGVVAVCFQPIRERVQRFVNRLMYGERDDPYTAIARLGRTLEGSIQLDGVASSIVNTVGQTLAMSYVALVLDRGHSSGERETMAEFGSPSSELLVVPLVHQGAAVGELRLAPRVGERLRERDHRLLADLAPHVAGAAHAVALSQELQLARQRIVQLREEERRRIRRDLHDGLGPALAGLTFTLEAVRNVSGSDLERADALLVSATEQVQTMISDVRQLIYGLRPPTLDQLGLTASIRGLAAHETTPTRAVDVEAPSSLPPLPAAVEVAAYWITQEALTNVRRHSHAKACSVRLAVEPTTLRLEVADNGAGLTNGSTGIGLHTMRERAAEVGGTCEIASRSSGGTLVAATLPRLDTEASPP